MTEFKMGDLVAYRDAKRIPTHALVLEVCPEGETLRITRGSAHESATVLQEDMTKPAILGAGITGLHRRLAYSVLQTPKTLEDKDQAIMEFMAAQQDAESKLRDIRKWMIAHHEGGEMHRSDLDTFLDEFGMAPYTKRWTGTVTITVSLTVEDARTMEAACNAAYDWAVERIQGESTDDVDMPDITRMTYDLAEGLT